MNEPRDERPVQDEVPAEPVSEPGTRRLPKPGAEGGTLGLGVPASDAGTRRLRPAEEDAPADAVPAPRAPEEESDTYSATFIDWGDTPEEPPRAEWPKVTLPYSPTVRAGDFAAPTPTVRAPDTTPTPTLRSTDPVAAPPVPAEKPTGQPPEAPPGDGVLRFGPGVPDQTSVTAAAVWHGTQATPAPQKRKPPRWRGYLLAAFLLLCSLAFAYWQWLGSGLKVQSVAVATDPKGPACDSAADIVATVHTNGRGGSVSYRWVRSDGTRSGVLKERFSRGQDEARIHLLWRFEGEGTVNAKAELVITEPSPRTSSVEFTYSCP
ncbi:hypothetical protein AB0M28_18120 [Streptomyces sp. NPDC051940]|uniref:hypothetical protein n=1 Tax=Streptomyces sp. NPDC051940 TaxID=3155675 RepID=UPI00343B3154